MRTYEVKIIHPTIEILNFEADWFDTDEENNLVLWQDKGNKGVIVATIVSGAWSQIKDLSVYPPTTP